MKRVKLWSWLSLIFLLALVVAIILTHSRIIAIIWILSIIVIERIEYRIKYITTCYKMYNKKKIKSFNLDKFDMFVEKFILKDVREELKLDEKLDSKA